MRRVSSLPPPAPSPDVPTEHAPKPDGVVRLADLPHASRQVVLAWLRRTYGSATKFATNDLEYKNARNLVTEYGYVRAQEAIRAIADGASIALVPVKCERCSGYHETPRLYKPRDAGAPWLT